MGGNVVWQRLSITQHEPDVEPDTSSPIVNKFSLLQGGPLYRLHVLGGMALPNRPQVLKRSLVAILVTWLPLAILALLQGLAYGDHTRIPFFYDYAVNIRFLITLPLLIFAEAVIDPKLRNAAKHF